MLRCTETFAERDERQTKSPGSVLNLIQLVMKMATSDGGRLMGWEEGERGKALWVPKTNVTL